MSIPALKTSPIFLLILNVWMGCCCLSWGCSSELTQCTNPMEIVEIGGTQSSCHGEREQAGITLADQQKKQPMVGGACACGGNRGVQAYTLPFMEDFIILAPITLLSPWLEPMGERVRNATQRVLPTRAVSNRLAPRLSVLVRFLI